MAIGGNTYNTGLSGLKRLLSGLVVSSFPSGLRTRGVVTAVTINDTTWTALPPTPLVGRNAMRIQNESAFEMRTNYDNTDIGQPLPAGYVGMKIIANGENYYDITDTIQIYAKLAPGSGAVTINIEEIA